MAVLLGIACGLYFRSDAALTEDVGIQRGDVQVVLREGEKSRRVEVSFAPRAPNEVSSEPTSPAPARPAQQPAASGGLTTVQVAGIAVGVTGVIGVGVGGALIGIAVSKNSNAKTNEDVDAARGLRDGGIVSVVVGGAASAVGLSMLLAGGADDGVEQMGWRLEAGPSYVGLRACW